MTENVMTNNIPNPAGELCSSNESSHLECTFYANYMHRAGLEQLYQKYMSNIIRIIKVHSTVCRLYILKTLDESLNNLDTTLSILQSKQHCRITSAIALENNLKDIFPDADPIYLELVGEIYAFNENGLAELIEKVTTKNKSYPKLKDYNARVKLVTTISSLKENFQVKEFLSICPDPINYFNDDRKYDINYNLGESMSYLCTKFDLVPVASLRVELTKSDNNLTKAFESVSRSKHLVCLKRKRQKYGLNYPVTYKTTENIEFLKEMAFLDHKQEIMDYIGRERALHKIKIEEAKSGGKLKVCECCYNDELLITEVYSCPVGHRFCSSCIKKGIEVAVGESKMDFKCFANCAEELSLTLIKEIVDDKLYQRIIRYKQTQEIKEANIEGLETCAFCDYSVILPPEFKIINCLNPDCKKETCRECREESHFPYRCDEIEKAPEVEIRTMIENKMTEVLIRICSYCKRKFVKEDGCNKMTCSCGKQMCYICRKPMDNTYDHFYHNVIIKDKCPLYTDENIVHTAAVEAAAKLIVNELKVDKPELLRNLDIDKILPALKKTSRVKFDNPDASSPIDVNHLVALIIGQNVEDIKNLEIRSLEPTMKKGRH